MAGPVPAAGGILNVAKPSGPSSHDVVNRVRRILDVRRVGHSGTLDPLADGVLLIGVGPATRLLEYLGDLPKRYLAGISFGQATDTQDKTGTVIGRFDASRLTLGNVEGALSGFRGEITQVPPMYSAVKLRGEKLYDRARRGESVERAPRSVTVHELSLLEFTAGSMPQATLEILCSAGTYVRTLCHDLGATLGVGATMTRLTRVAIGGFDIEHAASLEELSHAALSGQPFPWIEPARAVGHLPSVRVDAAQATDLRHGKRVALAYELAAPEVRALDEAGRLVAIGRVVSEGSGLQSNHQPQRTGDIDIDIDPNTENSTLNTQYAVSPTVWLAPDKVFPTANAHF